MGNDSGIVSEFLIVAFVVVIIRNCEGVIKVFSTSFLIFVWPLIPFPIFDAKP